MRISDWSSDVCSSDLWPSSIIWSLPRPATPAGRTFPSCCASCAASSTRRSLEHQGQETITMSLAVAIQRSEEHTSELQSLMRISYAVFCLKKKTHKTPYLTTL